MNGSIYSVSLDKKYKYISMCVEDSFEKIYGECDFFIFLLEHLLKSEPFLGYLNDKKYKDCYVFSSNIYSC